MREIAISPMIREIFQKKKTTQIDIFLGMQSQQLLSELDPRVRGDGIKAQLGVDYRSVVVRYGSTKPYETGPSPSTSVCDYQSRGWELQYF